MPDSVNTLKENNEQLTARVAELEQENEQLRAGFIDLGEFIVKKDTASSVQFVANAYPAPLKSAYIETPFIRMHNKHNTAIDATRIRLKMELLNVNS